MSKPMKSYTPCPIWLRKGWRGERRSLQRLAAGAATDGGAQQCEVETVSQQLAGEPFGAARGSSPPDFLNF